MEVMFTSRAWVKLLPCGRPRFSKHGHAYMPKSTKDLQAALREQWVLSYHELLPISRDIPLRADVIIGFAPAKSCIEDSGNPVVKHNHGDIDNLLKSVFDSLIGLVLEDDASICEVRSAKLYSTEDFVKITLTRVDKFDFLSYVRAVNFLDEPVPNEPKALKGKLLEKFVDHALLGVDSLYNPNDYISEEDSKSQAMVAWAQRLQKKVSSESKRKSTRKGTRSI
jgi:Holliday junction resolvase RusA-like endonuclease